MSDAQFETAHKNAIDFFVNDAPAVEPPEGIWDFIHKNTRSVDCVVYPDGSKGYIDRLTCVIL